MTVTREVEPLRAEDWPVLAAIWDNEEDDNLFDDDFDERQRSDGVHLPEHDDAKDGPTEAPPETLEPAGARDTR